jgi:hypothetical protein
MRNETRLKYNAFAAAIATLNGVDDATKSFSVSPSVQQTLETRIQQSSEFLTKINMVRYRIRKAKSWAWASSVPLLVVRLVSAPRVRWLT